MINWLKDFWTKLKRTFGVDPVFNAEMDSMVGKAEMQYLLAVEKRTLTCHELQIVNMLAEHSYASEVRARAAKIIRTGEVVSDSLKDYQRKVKEVNAERKQQILKAMKEGPCRQAELRKRLRLGDEEVIADMCWSLCMELEEEGKLKEDDSLWSLA